MGNTASQQKAGAKPINELDVLRDTREEYFASIEYALEQKVINDEEAYKLLAERARQRSDEAQSIIEACKDPERMHQLPLICGILNEHAEDMPSLASNVSRRASFASADSASIALVGGVANIESTPASDEDVKRYESFGAKDREDFLNTLEYDIEGGKLTLGAARDLAERYVARFPSLKEWMWMACNSNELQDFPNFCRIVEAHRLGCGTESAQKAIDSIADRTTLTSSRSESYRKSFIDERDSAKSEIKRLRSELKQKEAELMKNVKKQAAQLKEAEKEAKSLAEEQRVALVRLEQAKEDCSRRSERAAEDSARAESAAKRAKADCDKRGKNIAKARKNVEQKQKALDAAIAALKKAEEQADRDCEQSARASARALELASLAESLQSESAPEEDLPPEQDVPQTPKLVAADILEAADHETGAKLNASIVLPHRNPYEEFTGEDDPDYYNSFEGGNVFSLGYDASRYAYEKHKERPFSESLMSRPTNEHYLALYHDLLSQSPWTEKFQGGEKRKFELMRELEQRFFDGKPIDEKLLERTSKDIYVNVEKNSKKPCRTLPFDFTPFGTDEVFVNWPANRPIRSKNGKCQPVMPDEAWLRSKVSTTDNAFDIRWYDPSLYFAHASMPRLVRMQVGKMIERKREREGEAGVAAFAKKVQSKLDCDKSLKRDEWQQCIVNFLTRTLTPVGKSDSKERVALQTFQRRLYDDGSYLSVIRNKTRTIAHYAAIVFEELLEVADRDLIVHEAYVLGVVIKITEMFSFIYAMVSAFDATSAKTLDQQKDRQNFINEVSKFIMKKSKKFEDRAIRDAIKHKIEGYPLVGALRWTLYFLSDEDDNECALNIPYECLAAALRKLVSFGQGKRSYLIDANVLRNFAIVNYNSLMACSDDTLNTLNIDESQLSSSFSGDLLDAQINKRTSFACSRRQAKSSKPKASVPPKPKASIPPKPKRSISKPGAKSLQKAQPSFIELPPGAEFEDLTMSQAKEQAKTKINEYSALPVAAATVVASAADAVSDAKRGQLPDRAASSAASTYGQLPSRRVSSDSTYGQLPVRRRDEQDKSEQSENEHSEQDESELDRQENRALAQILRDSKKERDLRASQRESSQLTDFEKDQEVCKDKVLAWRKMRMLENLKTIRGNEGSKSQFDEASEAGLAERKELMELSKEWPELQKLLPHIKLYAELRRLERDDDTGDRFQAKREEVFKDLKGDGVALLVLLEAESKWLDDGTLQRCSSIAGLDADENSCAKAACRLSLGSHEDKYNQCYDPEMQKENRGFWWSSLENIKD